MPDFTLHMAMLVVVTSRDVHISMEYAVTELQ